MLSIKFDCNPNCCITKLQISPCTDDMCFTVCGILFTPTYPSWISDPATAADDCSTDTRYLVTDPNNPSAWCGGVTMGLKLCSRIHGTFCITATLSCGGTATINITI